MDAGNGRSGFTNQSGFYSLLGLPGGTYYLRPSKPGLTFSPSVRAVVVPPNVLGQDFKTNSGYLPLSSLGGRITDMYNHPIAGVSITDGNERQTVSDDQGFYSFTDLPDGEYTLTPVLEGYNFYLGPITLTVQGEEISGLNYTALHVFSISGRVTLPDSSGLTDVIITDDFGNQAVTDTDGYFVFTDMPAGSYTLTAAKSGFTFKPEWLYIEVLSANVEDISFAASP